MTIQTPTTENIRFHAAGHLSAAHRLVETGQLEAARIVLDMVREYIFDKKVQCPPKLREMIVGCIKDPVGQKGDIAVLEAMFCDELNTEIEKSGGLDGGFGGG